MGDLGFNLTIFNPDKVVDSSDFTIVKEFLGASIRCIAWDELHNIVYIGTMEGIIYTFNMKTKSLEESANLLKTITLIKIFNIENVSYLFASTTGGNLFCFTITDNNKLIIHNSFCAHEADKTNIDERFGSLSLYAEIWSLTGNKHSKLYSSNEKNIQTQFLVATSSEDQTVKIWEIDLLDKKKPELKHSFKEHHLAVTCLDWKVLKNH